MKSAPLDNRYRALDIQHLTETKQRMKRERKRERSLQIIADERMRCQFLCQLAASFDFLAYIYIYTKAIAEQYGQHLNNVYVRIRQVNQELVTFSFVVVAVVDLSVCAMRL